MQLTVYDGAGTIGGNKILVETQGTAFSFDFGISYSIWSSYFEEYLKPRAARGILDPFTVGMLPPIDGIYRDDYFPSSVDMKANFEAHPEFRKLELNGILLSHAHLDHSGHISFLKENIPVYCSPLTAAISKAVQDTSQGDFEKEVCYKIPKEENEDGFIKSSNFKKVPAMGRPFHLVNPGSVGDRLQEFWKTSAAGRELVSHPLTELAEINGLPIRRYTVDHSIFGSSAFAVETKEGWVVYTGDMRLSGRKGHLTKSFAEAVSKLNPVVLITEGTRIYGEDDAIDVGYNDQVNEDNVFQNCLNAVKNAKGLVIADFGPRNLERLLTFLEIAKQTGRKLAVMSKDAYILEQVHAAIPNEVADPLFEETIVLFRDVKSSMSTWEKVLLDKYGHKMIDGRTVRKSQKDYIVCMSFLDINELIDINPDEGSVYIYSSSEAYSEEQKIDFKRLLNWLRLFNVKPIGVPDPSCDFKVRDDEKGYHVSGHMMANDLLSIIRTINPKIVVPVHTEHPGFFKKQLEEYQVFVPQRGKKLEF